MTTSRKPTFHFASIPLILPMLLTAPTAGAPVKESRIVGPPQGSPALGRDWPRWGGPDGDFKVESSGLADSWPLEGPPLRWSRPLGEGYSAVVADAGDLFSAYREGDSEVVIALRADDGRTLWEHRYDAPAREGHVIQFGKGPNATPLLLDDRVVTLGYSGDLKCLDRRTGQEIWSHSLLDDLGAAVLEFGYAASPILHDGKVVVLVGGERYGVVAFHPGDGAVSWSSPPSSVSYATPIVVEVGGQEQVVYFSADEILAVEPRSGKSVWSFPVVNQYRNNATGPLWDGRGLLWVATQLDGGTRVLRLSRAADATRVDEVWSSGRLSMHFWNALRIDDTVYASIGGSGSVLVGVDLTSGEIRWRERGFEKVNFVHVGDRTILLDANGHLALASLGPDGLEIRSEVRILEGPTWTAPTLVGTILYVRDKQSIRAFDLADGAI